MPKTQTERFNAAGYLSRRQSQRNQIIADGIRALELIQAGRSIGEVMMIVPGSRARLYRVMAIAQREAPAVSSARRASDLTDAIDPLLS